MCFSATASFVAGAALSATGAVTLHMSRRRKRARWFAAIPLLFGLQQLVEGFIWLSFGGYAWLPQAELTIAYSLFSHVLWPMFVPVAVLTLEPMHHRRLAIQACWSAGVGVALYLLALLLRFPVVAEVQGGHIAYVSPHFFEIPTMLLYLVATCASSMFSSHRSIKVFGWLSLVTFTFAYWIHAATMFSVWCFFAAILSFMVIFILRSVPLDNTDTA
ncbi:MAG: DUF6629 family protein [Acidiferrobacterales bacterium]|nr:DUF6629 family protein [Acidiferrobacterales bacterium]